MDVHLRQGRAGQASARQSQAGNETTGPGVLQQLKDANVGGTLECLRLAAAGSQLIPLQYIGTMGSLPRQAGGSISEDVVLEVSGCLSGWLGTEGWMRV